MAVRWMQNTGIMTLQETKCHIEPDWLLIYEIWALIQTHLNSTNNSVVVLHKNASFRNLKIMTTKKL